MLQHRVRISQETESGVSEVETRFQVLCSARPGVFSYGGDLRLFASLIRRRDRNGLAAYAKLAAEVVCESANSRQNGITTIAVVEGTAFGGGVEAALAADFVIAERGVDFGFPEIRFNLFPGMGAYQLLSRRIPKPRAEEIILSGSVYKAEELHELGVIDVLVEPGEARQAAMDYVARGCAQIRGRNAFSKVVGICREINRDEIFRVADIWVDTAMELEERDLRIMDFLSRTQDERHQEVVN